jgi:hypothetical protein
MIFDSILRTIFKKSVYEIRFTAIFGKFVQLTDHAVYEFHEIRTPEKIEFH